MCVLLEMWLFTVLCFFCIQHRFGKGCHLEGNRHADTERHTTRYSFDACLNVARARILFGLVSRKYIVGSGSKGCVYFLG